MKLEVFDLKEQNNDLIGARTWLFYLKASEGAVNRSGKIRISCQFTSIE
jgi:hypothetical protein